MELELEMFAGLPTTMLPELAGIPTSTESSDLPTKGTIFRGASNGGLWSIPPMEQTWKSFAVSLPVTQSYPFLPMYSNRLSTSHNMIPRIVREEARRKDGFVGSGSGG
uniref:Uncharacterized protein n=1 Tax=Mantoniella antarctica TaxID=81844 RepID=A0A7S0SIZ6_9CHLO